MKKVCLFLCLVISVNVFSQNVGIGTTTPNALLHVKRGAVLFDSTIGTTPISGPGTRMMWIPEKAAFRAGMVNGTQWDDNNIGIYSFASGVNCKASGDNSTAMNQNTTASGVISTAMGGYTIASGAASTSMGYFTNASGFSSTAMGQTTTASGYNSTAMGQSTTASSDNSTTMGYLSTASGDNSTAMGQSNTASGVASTAMGYLSTASGSYSTAMGENTKAGGFASTSMGYTTKASGDFSTAMSLNATASGFSSTAMGFSTKSKSCGGFTTGLYNDSTNAADPNLINSLNRIFQIGNGTADNARSNAMTVLQNGNVGIGTVSPVVPLNFASTVGDKIALWTNGTNHYGFGIQGSLMQVYTDGSGADIAFGYGNSAAFTEKMRIKGDGNVGIGTTAPTAKLSVNGAANNATGTWGVFSDDRVKSISCEFTDGLNIIKQINPVKFRYNEEAPFKSDDEQIGIVAQELEKIAPYMVSKQSYQQFTDLREVNNQAYVFLLINAVKEQQVQIETQQKENKELKKLYEEEQQRINNLEKIVKELSRKIN